MAHNPYEPPPSLPNEEPIGPPRRPTGIAILAGLHLVGGLLIGALGVFLITQFDSEARETLAGWGSVIVSPPLAVLSIATAIGLWRGRKWAWWLATIYYFQSPVAGLLMLSLFGITSLSSSHFGSVIEVDVRC